MQSVEPQKFGDVAPLVTAATGLFSAGWALVFGVVGRKKWYPNGEPLQELVARISFVVAAVGVAYVYYNLTDPDQASRLKSFLWPAAGLTVTALLLYIYFYSILVHERWLKEPHQPNAEKIIGGFSKTRITVQNGSPSPEEQIWGSNRDPNLVWPPEARAKARVILTAIYLLLVVAGAAGLTYGGAAVIAARAPRIEDFFVDPKPITSGEVTTIRWRIVNADEVELKPCGHVESLGSLSAQPSTSVDYKLTAKNKFAERGIQRTLVVRVPFNNDTPSASKPRQPQPNAPAPNAGDCVVR
ncbi:MAG TPA: hypothetical protein VN749_04855 [Candidatus Eisenbacteria bacterium]|nr:hypothetical protein [Candidatus Eisenbacteria bacterium]